MTTPILTTKIFIPPVRPELVSRPRLIERLNAGPRSGRKLTLVSAPAGFGKTTMLSEWIAGYGPRTRVAWLSLDQGDNNLARFLAYLVAALQTIEGHVGQGLLATLQSPGAVNVEAILTALLNEIAGLPDSLILVFDDYHVIGARPIHDALTFLLDHLPPPERGLHLVIAGRSDPPLPLSRLRGRGLLTELRTADLRFTPDEAAAFLNQVMGLGLAAEDVAVLEARTEGWIVGLQMAALSMQGRGTEHIAGFIAAFTGSHRFVLDYFTDEVLLQQPESVQTFLLRTAILDRLSGSLCDAVTGQDSGQEMLEQLEAANLFIIPLDDERRWYRYHHLFADLLRKRLGKIQPDLMSALHRQASEWYEKNALIADAVSHALASGNVDRVARLVEGNALAMIGHGELTTLVRQLDALPDEVVRSRPWLCVAHAWVLVYAGQLDAVESHLGAAERALDGSARHIAGHIAAIRACVADFAGDKLRAAQFAREALEHLPEEDLKARGFAASLLSYALYWSGDLEAATQASAEAVALSRAAGDSHVAVNILCELIRLQIVQGQLHKAVNTCREALQLIEAYAERGRHRLPITGHIYAHMSHVLYEWNELEAALHHAREGVELCRQWGQAKALIFGYRSLARALQASGDADGALDAIREARQFMHEVSPWYESAVKAQRVHLWLAQGDVAAASRWVQESRFDIDKGLSFPRDHEYLTLARVLIAQGRRRPEKVSDPVGPLNEALGLLVRLLRLEEAAGAMGRIIEILVLQAMALQAQSEGDQALATLERALTLAEPEGYVRIFIDEGAPMAALLRTAASRGIAVDYVGKLLAAFGEAVPPALPLSSPSLIEPLSERELEVLRLLAVGLSNREIAAELFLALGTVKKHTSNIYGKLNVFKRTQAVARARELGLL